MNKKMEAITKEQLQLGHRFFKEVFEEKIYDAARHVDDVKTVLDIPQLVENCEGLPKIKTFQLAISDTNGQVRLSENRVGGSKVIKNPSGWKGGTYIAKSKTLAIFMKEQGIEMVDVLKIDIEGHEGVVFRSEDFKSVADKIRFIISEHGGGLMSILSPLGFKERRNGSQFIFEK